ncbi:MAG: carbamoyltransferase N-terminal domain-containing protein, partial [Planctomycetota bacterium]
MKILGLSAFGDGAGAALVVDGKTIAAAEEERFSRRPGDPSLPRRAARFCLARGGLAPGDLDRLVFSEKPLRRFERVLATQLSAFPRSSKSFARELFVWLGDRLWLRSQLSEEFGVEPARVSFTAHHAAHAAAAYFASPFDDAAILIADGSGEWATTTLARGAGAEIETLAEMHFPHSLGLVVQAVARHLGFHAHGAEELVSALAAHGRPRFADELARAIALQDGGHFAVDETYFDIDPTEGLVCSQRFGASFGPARLSTDPLRMNGADARDADLAASLQLVVENTLLGLARELHRRTPSKRLCFGGSLAHNVAANARLVADGPFADIFVPPAAGDAGTALGAALLAHALLDSKRPAPIEGAFQGEDVLAEAGPNARTLAGDAERSSAMLAALRDGRAVGWVRGRTELGPRALGHRALLADPKRADTVERIARGIRRSESFLSFSPALPVERAAEFFDVPAGADRLARMGQVRLRAKDAARAAAPHAIGVDGCAA